MSGAGEMIFFTAETRRTQRILITVVYLLVEMNRCDVISVCI
jgi:hypothetical protein